VKTLSMFSHRRAGEHCATPRALDAHHAVWVAWADPKAAVLGQLVGLWSNGPLWPSAAMRLGEIVKFSNLSWIYSNINQIQFGLNWNYSNFGQTRSLSEFSSSKWIQIGEYELCLQIQLNLIKPFWKILIIV
jgi:hypothetical protein